VIGGSCAKKESFSWKEKAANLRACARVRERERERERGKFHVRMRTVDINIYVGLARPH
jgi:hypothetical protein